MAHVSASITRLTGLDMCACITPQFWHVIYNMKITPDLWVEFQKQKINRPAAETNLAKGWVADIPDPVASINMTVRVLRDWHKGKFPGTYETIKFLQKQKHFSF